jgi:hypothetical protein
MRDYAAVIAALREKAKRSEFPEETKALNAKADELAKTYNVKEVTNDPFDSVDWLYTIYRKSYDDMLNEFFDFEYPRPHYSDHNFIIHITGEDQRWRRSYLWPKDGSPMMNPDHSWQDTDSEE